jgi:lysozyme family protein
MERRMRWAVGIGATGLAGGLALLFWPRAASAGAGAPGQAAGENATDAMVPAMYREDYLARWAACQILPARLGAVDRLVDRVLANRARYEAVSAQTGVPWWWIAAVHSLEADLSFSTHLHNGDPLTARTVHVPAGRPPTGDPPFTWEASAVDALAYDHVSSWHDWDLVGALYKLEGYNGMGYRTHGVPSPYLWSFSNQYARGKYVADGVWDPNAVSDQCGGATLWKRMTQRGLLAL